MRFTYKVTATVEVEVERTEGKFASRDELGEQLLQAVEEVANELENADPGSLEGEYGGQYEVVEWSVDVQVEEEEQPKPVKRRKTKAARVADALYEEDALDAARSHDAEEERRRVAEADRAYALKRKAELEAEVSANAPLRITNSLAKVNVAGEDQMAAKRRERARLGLPLDPEVDL